MARTTQFTLLFLVLSAVVSGCANKVVLLSPHQGDEIAVMNTAGPQFSWTTKRLMNPYYRYEFEIVVAKDSSFSEASVVYTEDRIKSMSFQIPAGEGWLPGGQQYYWKVSGIARDDNGETRRELTCEKPRDFELESRETVEVDLRIPKGDMISDVQIQIGDTSYTADSEFKMEDGEYRPISVTFKKGEESIDLNGEIRVVGVNENTKVGTILMDSFTEESLISISEGNVGKYSFKLGGQEIVKVNLGNR